MTSRKALPIVAAVLVFVWLHARTIPRTLEDEDSINLAFGVESFDVRHYAPHPPGYPVYIALAKTSTGLVQLARPDWSRDRTAAAGLAWLSVIFGAAGIVAMAAWWRGMGFSDRWAALAAIGAAASPLYWFSSARPLTDVPGFVAAVAIQAALVHGLRRFEGAEPMPRLWPVAALGAGVAVGLRSQTMWLTFPILAWILVRLCRGRRWSDATQLTAAAAAGLLTWFVPLVYLSGGYESYFEASRGLARLDFAGVEMLATHPTPEVLAHALRQTFLEPWRIVLPWAVIAAAAAGAARYARTASAAPTVMALTVLPYLCFHLLFQEVGTLRYALPTTSVVGGLAIYGAAWLKRAGTAAAVAVSVMWAATVLPVTRAYAGGWPAFALIAEMRAARPQLERRPVVAAHANAWGAASRAFDWQRGRWDVEPPVFITRGETLRLVRYWSAGGDDPVWFLSDPARRDLTRFDPQAATHVRDVRLDPRIGSLIGHTRPTALGWWSLDRPRWMLGTGWSVAPSMVQEARSTTGAVAWVRRDEEPVTVVVSAEHIGLHTPVFVTASIDGRQVDRWRLQPGERAARWLEAPAAAGDGQDGYARLLFEVTPRSADRRVVFDQFDASSGGPMFGYGRGWTGLQFERSTGRAWRMAAADAEIQVRHGGRPVDVTIAGTVPAGVPAQAPVALFAGSSLLATFAPARSFNVRTNVAPDMLESAHGSLTMATRLKRAPFGLRVESVRVAWPAAMRPAVSGSDRP